MQADNTLNSSRSSRRVVLGLLEDQKFVKEKLNKQFENLTYLCNLTKKISYAESLENIYSDALDYILLSLNADKASTLLFDDQGVMKFVAWKNLSGEYRKIAEGHSPWKVGTENPELIYIENVENEPDLKTLLPTILKEGIRSLAFVPLVSQGILIGKFMIYFCKLHHFTEYEMHLLKTFSSTIALAIYQKKAEKVLLESEEKFRTLVDVASDVIYTLDINGFLQYVNPIGLKIFIDPEKEHRKIHFLELVVPEQREKIKRYFDQLFIPTGSKEQFRIKTQFFGHPVFHFEVQALTIHGKRVWLDQNVQLLKEEGKIVGFHVVARDITDRKLTEEALHASEVRYQSLYEHVPIMNFTLNSTGEIIAVNRFGAAELGYEVEELLGKQLLNIIYKDDKSAARKQLKSCIKCKDEICNSELRIVRKNGLIIWVHQAIRVMDDNGKITLHIACKNISESKDMEVSIKQQLSFANALNEIASVIISSEDSCIILEKTTNLLGETLNSDRCLIYDVDFTKNTLTGLSQWLNPRYSDVPSTKGVYPISLFINGLTLMKESKHFQVSHFDSINPALLEDNSDKIIHGTMKSKSVLWYPFLFQSNGYYLLIVGTVHNKRVWKKEEIDFIESVSKQVSIALEKIRMLEERRENEMQKELDREMLGILNAILRIATENISLEKSLEKTLDLLLSAHFLTIQQKGGIFLVEDTKDVLLLKCTRNLTNKLQEMCANVSFGHCLCGQAASTRQIQHTDCVNEKHENKYEGIEPHGHYSVPIISENKILGVIVVYIDEGHKKEEFEVNFLLAAADTLAGIIKRKRAEGFLRESKERYQMLFENSPIGIYRTTPDGQIIASNPALLQMLGYSSCDELANSEVETLSNISYSRKTFKERLERNGFITGLEAEWSKVDDSKIIVRENVRVVRDDTGKVLYYDGTVEDITKRKRAEAELIKLSSTVEQSPVSVIITNTSGEIEYVNPKFTEATGYTFEEVNGKNPRILNSNYHDKKYFKKLWATILSGKVWKSEILNRKKNGELFWENAIISPILNDKGEMTHFVEINEDITEKKKLLTDLIDSKEKAEQLNKIKDGFIANMSHEIRTPLAGILGMNSLIKGNFSSQITEDDEVLFESVERSSQRLIRTVEMILNYSLLNAGDLKTEKVEIYLNEICTLLVKELTYFANNKNLQLVFENKIEQSIILNADENQIKAAITNLIENAIKYTNEGFVRLKLYKNKKNEILLDVSDSGIGIEPEKLEFIFQPYMQEEMGYGRAFEGVGLGLSISKKYFELNGFKIRVRSKKNEGAKFTINFGKSIL